MGDGPSPSHESTCARMPCQRPQSQGISTTEVQSAYNRPTRVRLPHPQPQAIGSVAERRSPKPLTSVRFAHGLPYGGYPQTACGPVPKTAGRESVPWVRLPHPPLHDALAKQLGSGLQSHVGWCDSNTHLHRPRSTRAVQPFRKRQIEVRVLAGAPMNQPSARAVFS